MTEKRRKIQFEWHKNQGFIDIFGKYEKFSLSDLRIEDLLKLKYWKYWKDNIIKYKR